MRIKSLVAGAAIVCAAFSAHAGTMGVYLNETEPGFWAADFDSDFLSGSLLSPSDTISFDDFLNPLGPGQYDVQLTFMEIGGAGNDPIINEAISLNGQAITMTTSRAFATQVISAPSSPAAFVLNISGTPTTSFAGYHGSITVTAVPEPESYAMLLAGLGLMGAVARRRKAA